MSHCLRVNHNPYDTLEYSHNQITTATMNLMPQHPYINGNTILHDQYHLHLQDRPLNICHCI